MRWFNAYVTTVESAMRLQVVTHREVDPETGNITNAIVRELRPTEVKRTHRELLYARDFDDACLRAFQRHPAATFVRCGPVKIHHEPQSY